MAYHRRHGGSRSGRARPHDAKISGDSCEVRQLAPEGGFALEPYPALLAWIARVQREPGFIAMDE